MANPKATFDHLYAVYSPVGYVNHLVRDLRYELPFLAMARLKQYSEALLPQNITRVTIVGSAHGLDAVGLKHGLTVSELLAQWSNPDSYCKPFPTVENYCLTLVDIQPEPLRFAADVNLADHVFNANLTAPHKPELREHFAKCTDVVTAVGTTSYLGMDGIEKIVRAAFVNGSAKILCFSVLKYLNPQTWAAVCAKYGLKVYQIGNLRQRSYKDTEEKERIHQILQERGLFESADKTGLTTSLYLAYKEEPMDSYAIPETGTLITVNAEHQFLGSTEEGVSAESATWQHPWHIALSKEHSADPTILKQLTEWHNAGDIQPGDYLTAPQSNAVNNIAQWSNMFSGEYTCREQTLSDGSVKQRLTRISATINANILDAVPRSSADLEAALTQFGHVLIRTGQAVDEQKMLNLMIGEGKAMDYRYGNTVRKPVKGSSSLQVTPWPAELSILPHSELTYHTEFPKNMSFICKEPAPYGGETSIHDCATAFERLSPMLQDKLKRENVIFRKRYVKALDHGRYPSWQQVVGSEATHETLIAHVGEMGYQCEILYLEENGGKTLVVETQLVRPMVYQYQGRTCLHASIVGIAPYWYEEVWPGKEPPLTAIWANGEPFLFEELREMENALLSARIFYGNWQKNDVMILDNPRVAHGRLPFRGKRVIGALMAQPAQFTRTNGQWHVDVIK